MNHDHRRVNADHPRRRHVFLVVLHDGRGADGPGVLGPARNADGEDDDVDGQLIQGIDRHDPPEDPVHEERDQDRREGHLDLRHAHDQGIDRPARPNR